MAKTKVLLGFIAGVAVGALAGVLLAPDSGDVTRQKLTRLGRDAGTAMDDTVDDVKNAASNAAADVQANADVIKEKVESKFEAWKSNYKSGLS